MMMMMIFELTLLASLGGLGLGAGGLASPWDPPPCCCTPRARDDCRRSRPTPEGLTR
jgi:hypothetical protein